MMEDRCRRLLRFAVLNLIFMGQVYLSDGRSTGAPVEACTTLTPNHGSITEQTGPSPYTISAPAYYESEQPLTGKASVGISMGGLKNSFICSTCIFHTKKEQISYIQIVHFR